MDSREQSDARLRHHHHSYRRHHRRSVLRLLWYGLCKVVFRRADDIPLIGILVFLVLFPAMSGSGEKWCLPLAASYCTILLCWSFCVYWKRRRSILAYRFPWQMWVLAAPLIFSLFQLIPCPAMTRALSPQAWNVWGKFTEVSGISGGECISISPEQTGNYCLLFYVGFVIGFLLINHCKHRKNLRWLVLAVVASALMTFLVGVFTMVAAQGSGVFSLNQIGSGAFLNKNHFAFLMGMGIICDLALLVSIFAEAGGISGQRHVEGLKWLKFRPYLVFALFILGPAMLLTASRGAFLTVVPVACIFFLWAIFGSRRVFRGLSRKTAVMMIVVFLAMFVASWGALEMLGYRMNRENDYSSQIAGSRLSIWLDCVPLLKDYWLTGYGMGGFEDVFQMYPPSEDHALYSAVVNSAHNDWLELVMELGVPMGGLVILAIVFVFVASFRQARGCSSTSRWLAYGVTAAAIAALLHEFVDYSLRAPANTFLFVVVFCVLVLNAVLPRDKVLVAKVDLNEDLVPLQNSTERYAKVKYLHTTSWTRHLHLLFAIALLVTIVPAQLTRMAGEFYQHKVYSFADNAEVFTDDELHDFQPIFESAVKSVALAPGDCYNRMRLADCQVEYARLLTEESKRNLTNVDDQVKQLLTLAAKNMEIVAASYPSNGYIMRKYARALERAMLATKDDSADERIYRMFEYAYLLRQRLMGSALLAAGDLNRVWRWSFLEYASPAMRNLREEARLAAISKYLVILERDNVDYGTIFGALEELSPDKEVVSRLRMKNFNGHRAMFDYAVGNSLWEEAEDILVQMEARYVGDAYVEEQLFMSQSRLRLSMLDEEAFHLAYRKWKSQKRRQLDLCAEQVRRIFHTSSPSLALEKAADFRSRYPDAFKVALTEFDINRQLGHIEDAFRSLLVFAYANESLEQALLNQAWERVKATEGIEKYDDNFSIPRFVRAALAVRIHEVGQETGQDIRHWIRELASMERQQGGKSWAWIQSHLISFYLGRAYLMAKDRESAVAAYERALAISPDNIYVKSALARVKSEKPSFLVTAVEYPFALNSCISMVYPMEGQVTPPEFSSFNDVYETSVYLLCTGDVQRDFVVYACFVQGNKNIFNLAMTPENPSSMLGWRVGELRVFKVKCQPLLAALKSIKSVPVDGLVDMKVRLSGVDYEASPAAVVTAFEIKR